VLQVHAGEFFYIGAGMTVQNTADARWAGWYNSLCRASVPLFVMLSGYYLFPVGPDTRSYLRRRLRRVALPFVVWCALYALQGYLEGRYDLLAALRNVSAIAVNYGVEVGHLWFVYMLLGIYLIAPTVSPWVTSASRAELEGYLTLWTATLLLPYLRLLAPAWWGEAFWNGTPMLHYFSGSLGYAILAAYLRRFHTGSRSATHYAAAFLLVACGYAVTTAGFLRRLGTATTVSEVELTWTFESLNVAMMAAGLFLLFIGGSPQARADAAATHSVPAVRSSTRTPGRRRSGSRASAGAHSPVPQKRPASSNLAARSVASRAERHRRSSLGPLIVSELSRFSYGIFLSHIMLLVPIHNWLTPRLGTAALAIPVVAVVTLVTTYCLLKAVSVGIPSSAWLTGIPLARQ
jgi:surface polysaccharide O-acyltransferase-like enzyme